MSSQANLNLYVSYGMPKSGSTLAFELVRTMLELAGHTQPLLPAELVEPKHGINFIKTLDGPGLRAARLAAGPRIAPLVIKTHSGIYPAVLTQLRAGRLIGHAVCRDPRDIALSMLDAGRDGRAWGGGPNGNYRNVIETIPRLHEHVKHFLAWADFDHVLPIHYEQLAFNTLATAGRIADQLNLDVDVAQVVAIVSRQRFTQKNRAVSQRWKREMNPNDAARIADEFSGFIQQHCSDMPSVPSAPAQEKRKFLFGRFRRSEG